jgi:hypothetical protein
VFLSVQHPGHKIRLPIIKGSYVLVLQCPFYNPVITPWEISQIKSIYSVVSGPAARQHFIEQMEKKKNK